MSFSISIASLKPSPIQYDDYLVNDGPIQRKIDGKPGYALGRGYLMIDWVKAYPSPAKLKAKLMQAPSTQ